VLVVFLYILTVIITYNMHNYSIAGKVYVFDGVCLLVSKIMGKQFQLLS